jgi:hypothetical protein
LVPSQRIRIEIITVPFLDRAIGVGVVVVIVEALIAIEVIGDGPEIGVVVIAIVGIENAVIIAITRGAGGVVFAPLPIAIEAITRLVLVANAIAVVVRLSGVGLGVVVIAIVEFS